MKKPNYELKAKVLIEKKDLLILDKKLSYALHTGQHTNRKTGETITRKDASETMEKLIDQEGTEIMKEVHRINKAKWKRDKRLKDRTKSIISKGPSTFLTLTFTDSTLESTSPETRRRYVTRYLKTNCNYYVANIDFGGKNGREHYHAVVSGQDLNYTDWHQYWAIKGEKIRLQDETDTKLGKYLSKLTNHAIKKTTKRQALIYSRN